LLGGLTL